MTVRDALNSAMDEEMARDPDVFILGEEVGALQLILWGSSSSAGPRFTYCWAPAQVGEYQGAYKVSSSCCRFVAAQVTA